MVLSIPRGLVIFADRFAAHDIGVWKLVRMLAHLLCASCVPAASLRSSPPPAGDPSPTTAAAVQPERDGAHDFDWDVGTWKTHQRRLLHPLTGSNTWVEYTGTDVVRPLWDGANEGLVEADGPAGHLEIFTLRLYGPDAHQWSITFANRTAGSLSPPVLGEFAGGRGEFYSQEPYAGRTILVRFSVSNITHESCHFEQAFSADGGKTWEPNFIVDESRL
jgi:hypothetical protein